MSQLKPAAIFDRVAKCLQKSRSIDRLLALNDSSKRDTSYIQDSVCQAVVDRLRDINRSFGKVLDVGGGKGTILRFLDEDIKMENLLLTDMASTLQFFSYPVVAKFATAEPCLQFDVEQQTVINGGLETKFIELDEENLDSLVSKGELFDLVLSYSSNHWVNGIEGFFANINRLLKPDCPLIGCVPGEDNLYELRSALQLAEQEVCGGVSPRISPTLRVPDLASLLQGASFSLVTIDTEDLVVGYPRMQDLMKDLQLMGESNCIIGRKPLLRRDVLRKAEQIYRGAQKQQMHHYVLVCSSPSLVFVSPCPEAYGDERGIRATFSLLWFIGWSSSAAQPKPLARGAFEKAIKDSL